MYCCCWLIREGFPWSLKNSLLVDKMCLNWRFRNACWDSGGYEVLAELLLEKLQEELALVCWEWLLNGLPLGDTTHLRARFLVNFITGNVLTATQKQRRVYLLLWIIVVCYTFFITLITAIVKQTLTATRSWARYVRKLEIRWRWTQEVV